MCQTRVQMKAWLYRPELDSFATIRIEGLKM